MSGGWLCAGMYVRCMYAVCTMQVGLAVGGGVQCAERVAGGANGNKGAGW